MGKRLVAVKKRFESKLNGSLSWTYIMIDEAPTTNLRIILTLMMAVGTAIRYWVAIGSDSWSPSPEWLIFLAGMSGLDVWQHYNKRKTTFSPQDMAEASLTDAQATVLRNGHALPESQQDDEEIG